VAIANALQLEVV